MQSTPLNRTQRTFFPQFLTGCATQLGPEERLAMRRARRFSSGALLVFLALSVSAGFMHVGPLRTLVAVLAGVLFCVVVYASGELAWRRSDEFRRVLLAKSFFAASVLTFSFASVWGYVELDSGGTFPHLPLLLLPVMLVFLTTAAKVVIFRQNRAPRD